jgi:hypothetical protein
MLDVMSRNDLVSEQQRIMLFVSIAAVALALTSLAGLLVEAFKGLNPVRLAFPQPESSVRIRGAAT